MVTVTHATASSRIEIHPAARSAYEWTINFPHWMSFYNMPKPLLFELSRQPLHGVAKRDPNIIRRKKSNFTFQLYSPLWTTQLWPEQRLPVGTRLIHSDTDEMTDAEIEKAAWVSTLSYLVNAIEPNRISEIRDTLSENMPAPLHYDLLKSKALTDPMLCGWTGLARGTLVYQRKQKKEREMQENTKMPSTIGSVIDALKKPWNPDD